MPRYALLVQYNGAKFSGFQYQDRAPSVQGFLEKTLKTFVRQDIRIHAAGRTDTGVHAIGQVVHFDCEREPDLHALLACLNYFGRDIGVSVIEAKLVDSDFHARFSAIAREYTYVIRNHPHPCTFTQGLCTHVSHQLDLKAMQQAATILLGKHNFESFRATHCQAKNAVRTIEIFDLECKGSYILAHLRARSFLHNQVRIMMGSLIEVGKGKKDITWIEELLSIEDRSKAGPTSSPHGLFFRHVDYGRAIFDTKPELLLMG